MAVMVPAKEVVQKIVQTGVQIHAILHVQQHAVLHVLEIV